MPIKFGILGLCIVNSWNYTREALRPRGENNINICASDPKIWLALSCCRNECELGLH